MITELELDEVKKLFYGSLVLDSIKAAIDIEWKWIVKEVKDNSLTKEEFLNNFINDVLETMKEDIQTIINILEGEL